VEKPTGLVMPTAFGVVFLAMGILLRTLRGAAKDKSIVIFVLFIFVVLFWMAFEQAGNALNLWAEFFTDRHIGKSTYTAESFQSANPIFILLFAPIFSSAWVMLAKRGWEPRTPTKILIAMVLMAASFVVMVIGAVRENTVVTSVDKPFVLPSGLEVDSRSGALARNGQPFDAGRLHVTSTSDGSKAPRTAAGAEVEGVLAHYVVQEMFEKTAPGGWVDWSKSLDDGTKSASESAPVTFPIEAQTFKMPFETKDEGVAWDAASRTLRFTKHADAPVRAALAAAAPPDDFREAITTLEDKSKGARTTGLWLLLSYLFATLGELCLSPVGLSMVTKLAPRRFASLFMGVWLLTSSVAQYAGGSIGESWGRVAPIDYFWLFVWTSLIGAALLAVLVWPLKRLMHEVH
jgi:proton-dependent oligopeptide transporter, POT family